MKLIAVFLPIFLIAFKEIKTFTKILPVKIEMLTNYLLNLNIYGLSIQDIFDKGMQLNKTTDIAQNIFNQSWNFTMALGEFFVLALAITMIVFYLLVDKNYLKEKFIGSKYLSINIVKRYLECFGFKFSMDNKEPFGTDTELFPIMQFSLVK